MYSRTRCRVEESQRERFRLFAEVSSGPLVCHPKHARVQAENLSGLIRTCRVKYIITQIPPTRNLLPCQEGVRDSLHLSANSANAVAVACQGDRQEADDNPREFRKRVP